MAPTHATATAKAEVCSDESCQTGEQASGKCKLCATDVATVSHSENQCPSGTDCQCDGNCVLEAGVTVVPSAETEGTSCKSCKGVCEEECSSCAEARSETTTDKGDLTTTVGNAQGMGHGHVGDSQHAKDHQDFFFLLEHRDSIHRTVKNVPNGVETLTESDVADVANMIQTHVEAMYDRMEHANPIRMRDPIFREVFANAKKIKLEIEHTDHGIRVTETSDDAYAVKLVQEHAKVVSLWIKNGYSELPKNHPAPQHEIDKSVGTHGPGQGWN